MNDNIVITCVSKIYCVAIDTFETKYEMDLNGVVTCAEQSNTFLYLGFALPIVK
jgi:hypothetical protein